MKSIAITRKKFESVSNSLIRMKNVDVYVTGSNARLNFWQLEETKLKKFPVEKRLK